MHSHYEESMKAKNFLPYRMGYLTPSMVVKAEEELHETARAKEIAMAELRELIQEEAEIVCPMDDVYLLQFLRARKYNAKKAHILLQNYYKLKKSYRDLFTKADIPAVRAVMECRVISCLPFRDADDCVILMIRLSRWDPESLPMQPAMQSLTASILSTIEDPATQVCGVKVLVDVKGCSLRQIRAVSPRYLHLLSKALSNSLPVRFKGIHMFNESLFFQYLWGVLKLFLSQKIRNRVHFHGDSQKHLHKFLPKAVLPEEYGGDNTTHDTSDWWEREIATFYDKFEELLSYGYRD